jgi:hypothetical protein
LFNSYKEGRGMAAEKRAGSVLNLIKKRGGILVKNFNKKKSTI